jgi:hypothetical protein
MTLNDLFHSLADRSSNTRESNVVDIEKCKPESFPVRDQSLLNTLLYKNELQNKRTIPKNDDKKPLHEIIQSECTKMSDLYTLIEADIDSMPSKNWSQIPIKVKSKLIEKFCVENDIDLSENLRQKLLKEKGAVKYCRKNQSIVCLRLNTLT